MEVKSRRNEFVGIHLSMDVYAASARDRQERTFSVVVDRLLRAYYLGDAAELEKIERRLQKLQDERAILDVQLNTLREKAAQGEKERNEAWTFVRDVRARVRQNGVGTRRGWEMFLSAPGRAGKLPADAWQVIAKETGVEWSMAAQEAAAVIA